MIRFTHNVPPSNYHRVQLDKRSSRRMATPDNVEDPFALDVFDVIRFSGQSATALEQAAGLGQHTICKWFRNRNFNPTLRALQTLVHHLGYRLALEPLDGDDESGEPAPPQFASGRTYG